uniref:Transcriptional adapter 2B n=3 Tax=Bactrocera dorsalis TaxID=27457 RepID=A0A034VMW6_BACDO
MIVGAGTMSTTKLTNGNPQPLIPIQQYTTTMGVKNQQTPQLQINDVAVNEKQHLQQLLLQENNNLDIKTLPMSSILRAQLDELKHLPQPLGTDLLSTNEQQVCKDFNLPPTTYLSLKTCLLSGAPVVNNLSPVENSLRKYFVKVGWLSH